MYGDLGNCIINRFLVNWIKPIQLDKMILNNLRALEFILKSKHTLYRNEPDNKHICSSFRKIVLF